MCNKERTVIGHIAILGVFILLIVLAISGRKEGEADDKNIAKM